MMHQDTDAEVIKWLKMEVCPCHIHRTSIDDEERKHVVQYRADRITSTEDAPDAILGTSKTPLKSSGGQQTYATQTDFERKANQQQKRREDFEQKKTVKKVRDQENKRNRMEYLTSNEMD
eukprot:PhM_4_TR9544/c1_g2_i4/m.5172